MRKVLIQNLQQLDLVFPPKEKDLVELAMELEGVPKLFEQAVGTKNVNLPSSCEIGVNPIKGNDASTQPLTETGSVPHFSSPQPPDLPPKVNQSSSFSLCAHNSVIFFRRQS